MKLASIRSAAVAVLCLSGIGGFTPASADVFQLYNFANSADGYVNMLPHGFDLFGADDNIGATTTAYLATALQNETLTFSWTYTTHDAGGSYWDPAGFDHDGVFTALSPSGLAVNATVSGSLTLNLLAGDDYGFYVNSLDSQNGRGEILVTATPLPAALPLFAVGLGAVGLFGARRRGKNF